MRYIEWAPDGDPAHECCFGYHDPQSSFKSCNTVARSVPICRVISLCRESGRSSNDVSKRPSRIPYDSGFDT
jgi:hypothetical protein